MARAASRTMNLRMDAWRNPALRKKGYPPGCLACALPDDYPKVHSGLGPRCPQVAR